MEVALQNLSFFLSLQIDRRAQVDVIARHRFSTGIRAWRKLIHCLIEMNCLFGPFGDHLCNSTRVCSELTFFFLPVNCIFSCCCICISYS